MARDWQRFDEEVARYLSGALDSAGFERLQSALREGPQPRARFLDHCHLAQECSEVSDARGLPSAVSAVAAVAGGGAPEAARAAVAWWRQRAVRTAAAAAALLLLLGVVLKQPEAHREAALSPASEAIAERFAPGLAAGEAKRPVLVRVRVSLVERHPPGFQLTAVARTAAAWWLNQQNDWAPPVEDGGAAGEWLDRIGLFVAEPHPENLADLRQWADGQSFDSIP